MTKTAVILAIILGAIGLALVLALKPSVTNAVCSPSPFGPDRRETADTVFVGEVIRERLLKGDDRFVSTVRVAVTFKGNPGSVVTVFPLGSYEPDCSGGPRLQVGERALLFLRSEYDRASISQPIYVLRESQTAEEGIRYAADITRVPEDRLSAAIEFASGGPFPESLASFGNQNGSWRDPLIGLLVALGAALLVRLGLSLRRLTTP